MAKKCWIVPDRWKCYVESDEIPLEVCKLCAETRLKLMELKVVRRVDSERRGDKGES